MKSCNSKCHSPKSAPWNLITTYSIEISKHLIDIYWLGSPVKHESPGMGVIVQIISICDFCLERVHTDSPGEEEWAVF